MTKEKARIKVLVITPQYTPDLGPSAPIYTALCEDLHLLGCDVRVVTAYPHYVHSVKSFNKSSKFFEEEKLNGLRILRTYVYKVSKNALWRRLLYHASFNVFSTFAALRVGKPDIVLADAPTLWSGLPLLVKAIFPQVPFVYIVHDIYPDVLFKLGILTNTSLIKTIECVEGFFYKQSVQVSVLSSGFKENLLQKGVPESKIAIIPACVDVQFIQPLPRENELRDRWGLRGKFVVLYAGNIGFTQDFDTLLKTAQSLIQYPNIVFVLVGEGSCKQDLKSTAEKNGLKNIKFFDFQPRRYVPFVYALADVCLVSLKRDIVVESVPSKTYTIMASGRPVLATVDQSSEVSHLLEKARCGFCIEPENQDDLARAILQLYNNDFLRNEMGARGRDFAVNYYSRKVASNQYYMLIQKYGNKD